MSKQFDKDQARHSVGPVLGLNCLQMLSVDDTSWRRVNSASGNSTSGEIVEEEIVQFFTV